MKELIAIPLQKPWVLGILSWTLLSGLLSVKAVAEELECESEATVRPKVGWFSQNARTPIRSERNVPFSKVGETEVLADFYRPETEEQLPLIVMIHGGAWITGDKWNTVDHARQMAQSGFVVMSINYRLAPQYPWPAQLEDCYEAVQYALEHAEKWKMDTENIGLWGYSAGGHLALMLALRDLPNRDTIRDRIKAVVAGGPPCDLNFIPEDNPMLSGFLGGTRQEVPERYRDASPIEHVSTDAPPVFFFHGTADRIVPIDSSRKMFEKLTASRVSSVYHSVEDLGHLMAYIDRESRLKAIQFLKSYLVDSKDQNSKS